MTLALDTGQHGEIIDFLNTQFRNEIAKIGRDWVSRQMAIAIQSPCGDRRTINIFRVCNRSKWFNWQRNWLENPIK